MCSLNDHFHHEILAISHAPRTPQLVSREGRNEGKKEEGSGDDTFSVIPLSIIWREWAQNVYRFLFFIHEIFLP
jgi:hypothetical protein